jgi:hypothetical protein
MPRSFTGTSVNFDLKEALIDALEQATTLEGGQMFLLNGRSRRLAERMGDSLGSTTCL